MHFPGRGNKACVHKNPADQWGDRNFAKLIEFEKLQFRDVVRRFRFPAQHSAPAVDHYSVLIRWVDDLVDVEMIANFHNKARLLAQLTRGRFGNAFESVDLPTGDNPTTTKRLLV